MANVFIWLLKYVWAQSIFVLVFSALTMLLLFDPVRQHSAIQEQIDW